MKHKKIVTLVATLAVVALGLASYQFFHKKPAPERKITGTVANVIHRPNHAEDGYYGFDVSDATGKKYIVNATGYLNTALTPDSRGDACVDVPSVKAGDKIEFNLPKSPDEADTFEVCYKQDVTGYYFKLEK